MNKKFYSLDFDYKAIIIDGDYVRDKLVIPDKPGLENIFVIGSRKGVRSGAVLQCLLNFSLNFVLNFDELHDRFIEMNNQDKR